MSIMTAPTTICMTKDFERHFANSADAKRGVDADFGVKLDRQLVDIDGGYRNHFLGVAFDKAIEMVESYRTGFWLVAELNHGDSFFIYPTDRGDGLFRVAVRDNENQPIRHYDLDDKTLGLLCTVLALEQTKQDAQAVQRDNDEVVKNGGEANNHHGEVAKIYEAKRVELMNMIVNSTEEVTGTATHEDAIANIALREFILSCTDREFISRFDD